MQATQAKPARAGGWIAHLWPADLNCCVFQATWIFPTFPGFLPSGPGYIPKWTDSDISTFSVGVYFLSSPNTWPTKDSLIVSHLRGAGGGREGCGLMRPRGMVVSEPGSLS